MLESRSRLSRSGIVFAVAVCTGLSPAIAQPAASAADLIATVLPEAVNISVTNVEKTPVVAGNMESHPSVKQEKAEAAGFIIDPSGVIVTNRHAVADAADITVILHDGTRLGATVLASATQSDIALLQVHADRPLPAARFGDSDKMRPGDPVFLIGNPFGLQSTVTSGIVSAVDRNTTQSESTSFMQIDAPLNRGNSGGPVFNAKGEVIAVGTALLSASADSGSVGLGYAIPANDVRFVVDRLRADGHFSQGWIGAYVQPVNADIAAAVGLAKPAGSIVVAVSNDTPAAHAGLSVGDVILKVGDKAVDEPRMLNRDISESGVGSTIVLAVWRDGALQAMPVVVGQSPPDQGATKIVRQQGPQQRPRMRGDLGLVVGPITDDIWRKLGLTGPPRAGVAVNEVVANSVAADRGIAPGSLILNVDRQPVASSSDLQQSIEAARNEQRRFILVLIQDQQGLHWVPLPLPA